MWSFVNNITEQISVYSTISGQVWYLCVFFFRLIVVSSIGGAVYGDEQSAFRCSTKVLGCENVCYDRFAKISHIRFWSFQLLTLSVPVVVFHFYTIYVQGNIAKLKKQQEEEQDEQKDKAESQGSKWSPVQDTVLKKANRRKKRVGKMVKKQRYDKNKLQELELTRGIHMAYFVTVICRIVVEFVFLVLAYDLFRFGAYPNEPNDGRVVSDGRVAESVFDLFWIRVPQLYRCSGDKVRWACGQHLLSGNDDAYVPCWVSRPWEKTIFLRYMNGLSLLCLILSIIEMVHLLVRICKWYRRRQHKLKQNTSPEKVVPPAEPNEYQVPVVQSTRNDSNVEQQQVPQLTLTNGPTVSQPQQQTAATSKKSNPFDDIATGKMTIQEPRDELRRIDETKPTKKKRPSRQTRFYVPSGTQSLNRPKKMLKTKYVPIFKTGRISFSESEGEDDDFDEDSSSSEETQLSSVSQHSAGPMYPNRKV